MDELNKLHVTSTTQMSLNDRFSILQSQPAVDPNAGAIRARRRSSSRQRYAQSVSQQTRSGVARHIRPVVVQRSSVQNRALLAQLDLKHKMNAALKIKRKRLRSALPVASVQNDVRRPVRQQRQTAPAQLRSGSVGNRFSRQAIAQNGIPIGRRRSSVSAPNPPRRGANGNGMFGRIGQHGNQAPVRGRSRSRSVVTPSNARERSVSRGGGQQRGVLRNQPRSNSRGPAARSNSRGRSASRNRQGPILRGRQPSVNAGRRPPPQKQHPAAKAAATFRQRSSSRGRQRQASPVQRRVPITARLGRNGVIAGQRPVAGVAAGRVQKKKMPTAAAGPNAVRGRSVTRNAIAVAATARRSRSAVRRGAAAAVVPIVPVRRNQSRSRPNVHQPKANIRAPAGNAKRTNIPNKANRSQAAALKKKAPAAAAGKPKPYNKARAGAAPAGGRAKKVAVPPKTREQLDNELDQYMVNTKASNDLDILMN